MTTQRPTRGAATTVEFAVIASATLLILVGLVVGALGVFRYQELARLAREGARWASVRGATYANDTGKPAATRDSIYEEAIKPRLVILDPSKLTVEATWNPDNYEGDLVTVRVGYTWLPEAIFGTVTMSSSATVPITY